MTCLRSGLTIRASEPNHSERTNPPSEQLFDDSMTGEQFNNDTVASQPEEGNKPLTGDTGVEQGDAKTPGKQGEYGLTVIESATEFPGPTPPCAACVTVEAPRTSQQSDSVSDKPTDIPAESDFLSPGEPNSEAASYADCQIGIFLDKSLVEDITPAATTTSNDTSFGDGSQVQRDADHWLLVPDCRAESEDKSPCDSASNQPPLSTGVQATKTVESDNSGPGETFLEMTGKDIGSAIMIMDEEAEQTTKPDSAIVIIDEDTEQTTKPRRYSPRNAAKRSFKDFVRNDSLWMGKVSEDLDEIMQLTDYVLAMSEKVVKSAKVIKSQLIESQKYIRECGGEEMKVTDRLERL